MRFSLRSLRSLTTVLAVSAALVVSGCSSDPATDTEGGTVAAVNTASGDTASGDTASGESVEGETYAVVSDAEVAAGFAAVKPLVAQAAQQIADGDKKLAGATVTGAYTAWYTFEGTVRKVDQSRYLDLEDALGAVKTAAGSGDKAKAEKGASDFARLADSYLTDHPDGSAKIADDVAAAASGPATSVDVQLTDYSILSPDELTAGTYEFTLDNLGTLDHEMVVFRTDLAPEEVPLDDEGGADEKGEGMTLVDEKEDIKVGQSATLRIELPAGRYLFACNVAGHWAKKMYKVVEVK